MKSFTLVVAASLFAMSVSALADTSTEAQSDANAIHKDNAAISNDQHNLDDNRYAKATDMANGDSIGQGGDSVKIEANKAAIAEKQSEKSVDKQIRTRDQN